MTNASAAGVYCPQCSLSLPANALTCPACLRLLHADRLRDLAQQAQVAERAENLSEALGCWRSVLELLPPDSNQAAGVRQQISRLSAQVDTKDAPQASGWRRGAATLGPLGALLWKAKTLLFGLSKVSTLLSMLASFGVYWTLWGWKFAAGFVISIYIHEMGHVIALRKFGIKATAPMFIPGFGALVRLQQYPASPMEDARVGLAGPIYGLGAAILWAALYGATGTAFWGAMTVTTAWLNLFNLLPIWQLDGSRGLRALSRPQRLILLAVVAVACLFINTNLITIGLLVLLGLRTIAERGPEEGDNIALWQFAGLVSTLSILTLLPTPHGITR